MRRADELQGKPLRPGCDADTEPERPFLEKTFAERLRKAKRPTNTGKRLLDFDLLLIILSLAARMTSPPHLNEGEYDGHDQAFGMKFKITAPDHRTEFAWQRLWLTYRG